VLGRYCSQVVPNRLFQDAGTQSIRGSSRSYDRRDAQGVETVAIVAATRRRLALLVGLARFTHCADAIGYSVKRSVAREDRIRQVSTVVKSS